MLGLEKGVEVGLTILVHCLIPPCGDFNMSWGLDNIFVQKASDNV